MPASEPISLDSLLHGDAHALGGDPVLDPAIRRKKIAASSVGHAGELIQNARPAFGPERAFVDPVNKLLVHGPILFTDAHSRPPYNDTCQQTFRFFLEDRTAERPRPSSTDPKAKLVECLTTMQAARFDVIISMPDANRHLELRMK